MSPTVEPPTAGSAIAATLLGRIRALPVDIDDAGCVAEDVHVPTYPGGVRPSAMVELSGGDHRGAGEHVAWSPGDHERLARVAAAVPRGRWQFGEWADVVAHDVAEPYARAALEAAALDLALRQAGRSLFALLGHRAPAVRYVISFAPCPDPVAEIHAWQERAPGVGFKVDVDPAWDDAIYRALAETGAVATLDFKNGGTGADHERAHALVPHAWIEDPAMAGGPWSASLRRRLSFDAPVASATALRDLGVRPAAVNVKPARLGGVLEALHCAAACAALEIDIYFGGMFEVGAGRRQLWTLAALLAPGAPNDVAPLVGPFVPPRRAGRVTGSAMLPASISIDPNVPGFGAA